MLHFVSEINIVTTTLTENVGVIFYSKNRIRKDNVYEELHENHLYDCCLLTSDNLVIYGHHIKGQKMFGALENYKSKDFKTITEGSLSPDFMY